MALGFLEEFHIAERFGVNFTLYDVLGDVVCGGFAQPIRKGYAKEIYMLTSGEYMSLYAANNIASSVASFAEQGMSARVGGLINNRRNVVGEDELIEEFAALLGVPVMGHIPRSAVVQESEKVGKTVVEAFPESEQAAVYKQLAENILNNDKKVVPTYLERTELIKLIQRHQGSQN